MQMNDTTMRQLKGMFLAPYMQLATDLIGKRRQAGGNMFRHQLDTMSILIDYGYIDSVLLKAAIIHDVIEDIPDYDHNRILEIDSDSGRVYDLVMEVTKRGGQLKSEYLRGIIEHGSSSAKVLKCADRISNMISMGFVTSPEFIERYCDETEFYVLPIALDADFEMYRELLDLVMTRRKYLEDSGYLGRKLDD
ncbi:HD domain-containing protein [Treponema endosymbiont of Eucomonympha sp.]|uniref:HD domain-containing protein n=1 Tax=Treponema endosymbiont of Eucomonympha sp. TaxID=1580831 RepID=UPI000784E6EC|nr:HD domain-containing protein [Treponema endosymbiont of Eucomonympha sp.]